MCCRCCCSHRWRGGKRPNQRPVRRRPRRRLRHRRGHQGDCGDEPLLRARRDHDSGLCDKPCGQSKAADCKTVVTRAEFEQLVNTVAPTIAPPARKQLATQYGMALVMVHKAHQMGLDQGPKFQELMRVARIGVLTKELSQSLQDEAGHVSDKEIENYYHNNDADVSGSRTAANLHTAQQAGCGEQGQTGGRRRQETSSRNPKTP